MGAAGAAGGLRGRGRGGVPLYYCFWRTEDPSLQQIRGGFPLAGFSEIKLDLMFYDDLNSIF